jgi:FAD:protein FMN transferase
VPSAPTHARVQTTVRRAQPWLGTRVEISASGNEPGRLNTAVQAAFATVARVQRLMSFHDPTSDVSRLNREAARAPVAVDPWTYQVLRLACELAGRSEGAFDPTVAPCLVAWQLLPAPGGPPPSIGAWSAVQLLEHQRVRFASPLWLDLGGIAKGYAVDRAVAALERAGVSSGIVNAGGDLRCFGAQTFAIGVRRPEAPGTLGAVVALREQALATSSGQDNRHWVDGRLRGPHVDPRSGRPWLGHQSVSVVARRCALADALTKVVLFGGRSAQPLLTELGASALELTPAGAEP